MTKATTQEKSQEKKQPTAGEMLISKIKLNSDGTAEIDFKNSNDSCAQTVSYFGKEEVTKDFREIFNANLAGFLGCNNALKDEKLEMNVVRFAYDGNGKLEKAGYSVKWTFADFGNAVTNINLNNLPIFKESLEKTFTISGKHEETLHKTLAAAKGYIKGDTKVKQMKLVVDNENPAKAAK